MPFRRGGDSIADNVELGNDRRHRGQRFAGRDGDAATVAEEVAQASARRTARLSNLQRHIAFALGGEAAARLAERLAMPTSPDTLLRMAAKPVVTEVSPPPPRVLGVDDWAWRRGNRYDTILVDFERNEVVDLLADRQAETLAAWLREHPGVEVVARDRAGAYAEGIRRGAPEAIQVSDRWHLLRSLGDAVRAVVDRNHGDTQRAAKQVNERPPEPPGDDAFAVPADIRMTAAQRRNQDAHARRHGRYEEAARQHAAGVSISSIAALTRADHKTIRVGFGLARPRSGASRRGKALRHPTITILKAVGPKGAEMPLYYGARW